MNQEAKIGPNQFSAREITTKISGYWKDPAVIETETRQALDLGIILSHPALKKARLSSLSTAIEKYYPGGMNSLRESFGMPIRKRSKGYWGRDTETIEQRAKQALNAGINLTVNDLEKARMSGLSQAAAKYYPGGLNGLKESMGIQVDTKPSGFWKEVSNIEGEAKKATEAGIALTQGSLDRAGMSSLGAAILQYYPGGLIALRDKFGLPQGPKRNGYWAEETIEKEAKKVLESGQELSRGAAPGLVAAIFRHYPGGLTALREKLGVSEYRKPAGFWQNISNIEEEVRRAISLGLDIRQRTLAEANMSGLATAITKYYPGKYKALRINLGLETRKPIPLKIERNEAKKQSGPNWVSLRNDPNFTNLVEVKAKEFIQQGYKLTREDLQTNTFLQQAIRRGYPGGLKELRKRIRTSWNKPPGFWQDQSNIERELRTIIGKLQRFPSQNDLEEMKMTSLTSALQATGGFNYWRENLGYGVTKRQTGYWDSEENVEKEIRRVIQDHGLTDFPSTKQLKILGETALTVGVRRTGGYPKWRKRLGFALKEKPKNFWTPEEIEKQAQQFLEERGEISSEALAKAKRFDLQVAIGRHYPGSLTALKEKLGVELARKPEGYWTVEFIEAEAKRFYEERGIITSEGLRQARRGELLSAISEHYPGKLIGLRAKLGIVETVKPPNYWETDNHGNIITEAGQFYKKHGGLTHSLLRENNQQGLGGAIKSYYPGGMRQLKLDLGIDNTMQATITADQANEQLEKLLDIETIGQK